MFLRRTLNRNMKVRERAKRHRPLSSGVLSRMLGDFITLVGSRSIFRSMGVIWDTQGKASSI